MNQLVTPNSTMPEPSVAMNELIPNLATRIPLTSPITAPSTMMSAAARIQLTWPFCCRPMISTWARPTWYPTDMSNSPVARGTITANASSRVTDWLVSRFCTLPVLRKLSGRSAVNTASTTTNASRRPSR